MHKTVLIAALSVFALSPLAAEPLAMPKAARPASSAKVLPLKGAASGNSCASFGPGFIKVEGTDTCVRLGGAASVDAGGSIGRR